MRLTQTAAADAVICESGPSASPIPIPLQRTSRPRPLQRSPRISPRAGPHRSLVVRTLLDRIAALDGPGEIHLQAVLALAPDALTVAEQLDAERAAGRVRGPLHGVPVLIKDNIEAVGLPGSAGSQALADRTVTRDAPLVARLRDAGLLVLGSTNLSEWANIRSSRSTSGWSAIGGLTGNPWALDRSAGGSSSGSGAALAGGLAPLAIGTETDGSITCPSSLNGCVGLKPTVGLLPTEGVVPISGSQDAPGPMSRSVHDAALLLDALAGTALYGAACGTASLDETTLGIAEAWLSGHPATDALFAATIETLRSHGVTVTTVDVSPPDTFGDDELVVLLAELQTDLDAYLAARPGNGPASLADVVAFNREHAAGELAHFGQELFEQALTSGGRSPPEYAEARARNLEQVARRMPGARLRGTRTRRTCSSHPRMRPPGRAISSTETRRSVEGSRAPHRRSPAGPFSASRWATSTDCRSASS